MAEQKEKKNNEKKKGVVCLDPQTAKEYKGFYENLGPLRIQEGVPPHMDLNDFDEVWL